jgi:hypothetical protein
VTRGQDLTGKDFSGQKLIKKDFKTVSTYSISNPLSIDPYLHPYEHQCDQRCDHASSSFLQ